MDKRSSSRSSVEGRRHRRQITNSWSHVHVAYSSLRSHPKPFLPVFCSVRGSEQTEKYTWILPGIHQIGRHPPPPFVQSSAVQAIPSTMCVLLVLIHLVPIPKPEQKSARSCLFSRYKFHLICVPCSFGRSLRMHRRIRIRTRTGQTHTYTHIRIYI